MLVIIEGVDRTGKTTLQGELLNHHCTGDARGEHFGAPEHGSAIDEYLPDWLLEYNPVSDDIVIDRHYLGELVWPDFFDRPSRITTAERVLIELFLRSRGALLVLCTREMEGHRKAFEEADPPEPLPVDRINDATAAFSREFERSLLVRSRFDLDPANGPNVRDIAVAAKNQAEIAAAAAAAPAGQALLIYKAIKELRS